MATLRFSTAGESHGPQLTALLEGLPAGLSLALEALNAELARRQQGYGRGARMRLEHDEVQVVAGLRHGLTLGSPLALVIPNRDWVNWQETMSPWPLPAASPAPPVRLPRPGHADLAGMARFGQRDARNVLERASARETAARVAVGAVCRQLLAALGVQVGGYVESLGGVPCPPQPEADPAVWSRARVSDVACPDEPAAAAMREAVDRAAAAGDTLGGRVRVEVLGLPPGLGSGVAWPDRLDARLAAAVMSIPALKSVEFGLGAACADLPGSQVHDPILPEPTRPQWPFRRPTNHAGGVEGGMTNGEPLVIRAAMKPIPTLREALPSVNLDTGAPARAHVERSDVCAVPAALVVAEAMVAFVLAAVCREKFGGDSLPELLHNLSGYRAGLARLWQAEGLP